MRDKRKYLDHEIWLSKPRIVCGLMSGTSLDGVDAALVKFTFENGKHKFELLRFYYLPFDDKFKKKIYKVINSGIIIQDVSNLNFQLSYYYAKAIDFLSKNIDFKKENIDLIGMHGQTVWHQPPTRSKLTTPNSQPPTTLQLGSASVLCHLTGIPVVSDFRTADIALGGQGAPLVPIFDREFLSDKGHNVITLNIGGIANITYIPQKGNIIAFDTGPGNVLIDEFTRRLFKKQFDKDGKIAVKGKLSVVLYNHLKKIKFIKQNPPKSTGRELFNKKFFDKIAEIIKENSISKFDAIFTLTKFTAWSIAANIRLYADSSAKLIVSGGGASNLELMQQLKAELPDASIVSSIDVGINPDAKEAVCFAYLAYRNIANLPGNITSVTGAKRETILGSLTMP